MSEPAPAGTEDRLPPSVLVDDSSSTTELDLLIAVGWASSFGCLASALGREATGQAERLAGAALS